MTLLTDQDKTIRISNITINKEYQICRWSPREDQATRMSTDSSPYFQNELTTLWSDRIKTDTSVISEGSITQGECKCCTRCLGEPSRERGRRG